MNTNNTLSIWSNGLGPLGELRLEMDRFLSDYWIRPERPGLKASETEWFPACEVDETDDYYLLALEIAGIPKEQIRLEVIDNRVIISGERKQDSKKKLDSTWYSERRFGMFSRTFTLPADVSADKVEANYQDGILRIYVPKAVSAKPRQVKISNGTGTGFLGKLLGQSSTKDKEERHSTNDINAERVA